jgi:hypothetical protein
VDTVLLRRSTCSSSSRSTPDGYMWPGSPLIRPVPGLSSRRGT